MYDLTSSKEDELKLSQYISVIDESLLLQSHVAWTRDSSSESTILSDIFSSITQRHCRCDEDVSAYRRSRWIINSLITCNHNFRLIIWINFSTSSIFSSLTDFNMSLIFFVDQLWLLERMLSRRWKLCMTAFMITQRSNIVRSASNWDLLTLLTSIQTQNRIKRFVVNITYRWISLLTSKMEICHRYSFWK